MSLFVYGLQHTHGFHEHAAGEVRCQPDGLIVGRCLAPTPGIAHGFRVYTFFYHCGCKRGKIVMELLSCVGVQRLLVDEFYEIAEEDAMEQAAVAGRGIREDAVSRHMVCHISCCQCCILQILFVAGEQIEFVGCAEESADVVGENPSLLNSALLVNVVIYGSRFTVEEDILLPCVDFDCLIQICVAALATAELGFVVETAQACGNEGCRTVGTGIL